MKTCTTCKVSQPISEFNKHSKRKDGLQTVCRECNRSRSRRYYAENLESHRKVVTARNKAHRKRMAQLLGDYFMSHPCVDCGTTNILVLEFDHRGEEPKLADVSKLFRGGASWKTIMSEIAKCDVRCRNCHTEITMKRAGGNWRLNYIIENELTATYNLPVHAVSYSFGSE